MKKGQAMGPAPNEAATQARRGEPPEENRTDHLLLTLVLRNVLT